MGYPNLNPYVLPEYLCQECGCKMRPAIERMANGKVSGITIYCDTPVVDAKDDSGKVIGKKGCEYGIQLSMVHVMGQNVRYVAPPPQERQKLQYLDSAAKPAPAAQPPTDLTKIAAPATGA